MLLKIMKILEYLDIEVSWNRMFFEKTEERKWKIFFMYLGEIIYNNPKASSCYSK